MKLNERRGTKIKKQKSKINNKSIKESKIKKEDSAKIKNIKFTILAVICIILFCAVLAPVTLQNDTFYTIKIGEVIAQTKTVDMQEHFSWHEGLTYTYPHWAYDLAIYLIYNMGGFTGIFISTVVLSSVLGLVMYFTNCKIAKNKLVSFLVTLGAMYLIRDFIAARAQLVSFILLELNILCIEYFLETKKKRYAVFILLIGVAIANIHAAIWPFIFILFLPYIAEYILNFNYIKAYYIIKNKILDRKIKRINKEQSKKSEETAKKLDDKSTKKLDKLEIAKEKTKLNEKQKIDNREKRKNNPYKIKMVRIPAVKWLILIMVICVFTGLVTPIGDTPYTWTYKTMQGNTTDSINEHQPLTLINNKPMLIVLTFIIAMLVFTDVKIRLKDLFMIAGLILLMFMTRRQESMFLLFGSGIVSKWIADLFEKYDREGTEEFKNIMISSLGTIATILIVALFMVLEIKGKVDDKYVSTSSYPVEAAKFIKENIDMSSMKLFNEYNYGSYLLYEGIPVFIDSRADLYTPEFSEKDEDSEERDIFSDYISTSGISRYYEKTFEKYDITHVILYKNSKLSMLLSYDTEHYNKIYLDDNFIIYERDV